MSTDQILKALDDIEGKIDTSKSLTSAELKSLGNQQTELANRLLKLETRSGSAPSVTWGEAFTKSDAYKGFVFNKQPDAHLEVKNTITNTVASTRLAPESRLFRLKIRQVVIHHPTDVCMYRKNTVTPGLLKSPGQ